MSCTRISVLPGTANWAWRMWAQSNAVELSYAGTRTRILAGVATLPVPPRTMQGRDQCDACSSIQVARSTSRWVIPPLECVVNRKVTLR